MSNWSIAPGQLELTFTRAVQLRAEMHRKERAVGRKVQVLARALANLMEAGEYHHRVRVGLHAFDVEGVVCLASAYLEPEGDGHRYRYAVLCGGASAMLALRNADLDPSDSDEPGSGRQIGLATYADYDDFVERLPRYLADVTRDLTRRLAGAESTEARIRQGRREISAVDGGIRPSRPTPRVR